MQLEYEELLKPTLIHSLEETFEKEQSTEMGDEQEVAEEESGDEQSAHVPVEARHLVLYRPFPLFAA